MNRQLKNITLLSYNTFNPIQSIKALLYSSREIDFAKMILVGNSVPEKLPSNIEFVHTDFKGHKGYMDFTYRQLHKVIDTDFYICIHDDGFIINPHLWTDEFLNYDYIGAPWKNFGQKNRVGNGGFVLKSKKFIQFTQYLTHHPDGHDDVELTNHYYEHFTRIGCKYAPVELAMRFSIESKIPECPYNLDNCFGFHGRGNPAAMEVHDGEYQQFQDKIKVLDEIVL